MPKTREAYNAYMRKYLKERYAKKVSELTAMLGGKCAQCGATEKLEFDHIDPKTKLFTVTTVVRSNWNAAVEEARKCQLLCDACHLKKTAVDIGKPLSSGTHGTVSAYTHCGPPTCEACRKALRDASTRWRRSKGIGPQLWPIKHGTNSGYARCGPPKCDACRTAHNAHARQQRVTKRLREANGSAT